MILVLQIISQSSRCYILFTDVVQLESDTSTTANTLIKPQQDEEDDVVKKKLENYDHLGKPV